MSEAPWPLIEIAIEPTSALDQQRLGGALSELAAEDPTFRVSTDRQSGRTILGGTSELQLDIKVDVLRRAYKVEAAIGAPQVAYRETLGRRAEIDYTHKQQAGGAGHFARVKIAFEPTEPGSGYAFESKIARGSLPAEYIPGVEKALESAKDKGLLVGFPVIDFKATLVDGVCHDLDSSALTFAIAARAAFRQLRERAAPVLLEPIMKVEVTTPKNYVGDVVGDLAARHGHILARHPRGDAQVVVATAPLANMFGYARSLQSMTDGGASFTMAYHHYESVPEGAPPDDAFPPAVGMRAGAAS